MPTKQTSTVRHLKLPSGGTYPLRVPTPSGVFSQPAPLPVFNGALGANGTATSWPTIFFGAFLGGGLTWLLLKFSR